jgi:DNA processing protein
LNTSLFFQIALSNLKGIGDSTAKLLLSYCGSADAIFKTSAAKLSKIPGIGPSTINAIKKNIEAFEIAENEIQFIEKENIKTFFILDENYPKKLKYCNDAPILLYGKGNLDLNPSKLISIVGTRHATEYGKLITENLIADLAEYDVSIISGLAYGIDIAAHKSALKQNLPTIGVLAHGLHTIYPAQHRSIAEKMQLKGGILTEYAFKTIADKGNFPKRNRIVAGMTDATIVVESAISGGALITAELANNYNKDVLAFPGNVDQEFSAGCNKLIRENKAHLLRSANDLIEFLGWADLKEKQPKNAIQKDLFFEFSKEENAIFDQFKTKPKIQLDELSYLSLLPISTLSATLFSLEMKGYIKSLPGKMYEWI